MTKSRTFFKITTSSENNERKKQNIVISLLSKPFTMVNRIFQYVCQLLFYTQNGSKFILAENNFDFSSK